MGETIYAGLAYRWKRLVVRSTEPGSVESLLDMQGDAEEVVRCYKVQYRDSLSYT